MILLYNMDLFFAFVNYKADINKKNTHFNAILYEKIILNL